MGRIGCFIFIVLFFFSFITFRFLLFETIVVSPDCNRLGYTRLGEVYQIMNQTNHCSTYHDHSIDDHSHNFYDDYRVLVVWLVCIYFVGIWFERILVEWKSVALAVYSQSKRSTMTTMLMNQMMLISMELLLCVMNTYELMIFDCILVLVGILLVLVLNTQHRKYFLA